MAQGSGNAIRRYGIDHRCGFAGNQPVWPGDTDMDSGSEGNYVRGAEGACLQKRLKTRESHELLTENVLNRKSLFPLEFYRRARGNVPNADYTGVDGNFPNPVEVFGRR